MALLQQRQPAVFTTNFSLKHNLNAVDLSCEVEKNFHTAAADNDEDGSKLKELHTAFNMLDRNSDGSVYVDDIYDMMDALGQHLDKDNISDFIKLVGSAGNSIKEDEFISWMETLDHNNNHNDHSDDYILRGAFETFDKNKDGFISKIELKAGLLLIGEQMSDKMLDVMMLEADKDCDGLISYNEFVSIMR